MEQRAVIKFNARIGKNASETLKLMQQVYGESCLTRANFFRWHKHFLKGRDNLEDDEHTGRPCSSWTPDVIQKV